MFAHRLCHAYAGATVLRWNSYARPCDPVAMDTHPSIDARDAATLQAWLLALLRFAVTRLEPDRIVALAAAAELDRPDAAPPGTPAHRFFYRTTADLCAAIIDPDAPASAAALQAHLERITDTRLQRAFAAAVDVKIAKKMSATKRAAKPVDLWRGLGRRDGTMRQERRSASGG